MKKIAKALFTLAVWFLSIYVLIFAAWLMFGMGCVEYAAQQGEPASACGNDVMSQVIRTTHKPLILLMTYDFNFRKAMTEFAQ